MATRHKSLIPLSRDHYEGLLLVQQIRTPNRSMMMGWPLVATDRAAFVSKFYREHLSAHFAAEEETLFPLVLKNVPQGSDLVAQLLEEHRAIERYIEIFERERSAFDQLEEFSTLLEQHIRKEERNLFPLFEDNATPEVLEETEKQIRKRYPPNESK